MVLTTFLLFLSLFFIIGVASLFASKGTTRDYLMASKSVSPGLVGLSAVATNNSGFMFIGMIGATYTMGLSSIWIMLGWIAGDWLAQSYTVTKIRAYAQPNSVSSYGGLITQWMGTEGKYLSTLIGIITLVAMVIYAGAQLKAGTKATTILLDWPMHYGIIIASVIIFIYSLVGGLRASIWTDVAQSVVMISGMLFMTYFGLQSLGGFNEFWQILATISPEYLSIFPVEYSGLSALLFIIGWLFGGIAVIGQPHIVIRFMTLTPEASVNTMRTYYYGWFILFYSLTILVGLISQAILPPNIDFDAELALPSLASQLMPELFIGLLLAALFAATMSTADSLILACSAAITRDIVKTPIKSLWLTKVITFAVLSSATMIALANNQTVFNLVLDAWGLLGSAFAPIILWLSWQKKISEKAAILTIFAGIGSFLVFSNIESLNFIYSVTFGILAGLLTAWLTQRFSQTSQAN